MTNADSRPYDPLGSRKSEAMNIGEFRGCATSADHQKRQARACRARHVGRQLLGQPADVFASRRVTTPGDGRDRRTGLRIYLCKPVLYQHFPGKLRALASPAGQSVAELAGGFRGAWRRRP